MASHNDRLPEFYWVRRMSEIQADLLASAMHPRGAADAEALRLYLEWIKAKMARRTPRVA